MKWFRQHSSLGSKYKFFIYLGIVIWLLNFPVVFIEIQTMNHRVFNLERAEDLYNTILEMRRYEKNFFLYQRRDDLEAAIFYFNRARRLCSKQLATASSSPSAGYVQLNRQLAQYALIIDSFKKMAPDRIPGGQIQEKIRAVGKRVVDDAQRLLKNERDRISRVAKNALWWPLVFLGMIFCLFLAGATMVTQKVIKPLGRIERATEKIARGDFSPIPHGGKMESHVDHLVAAFNRMAQELEARQEQIIHSRKIASLGTLVSGTAHELNNPINNIILTVDTLVGGRKLPQKKVAALLDDILNQALRASEIVKNLLEFSRAQTTGYQELDLAALLKATLHLTENQMAMSGVRLHDEIDRALPKIIGNRQGLQQVFLNLITNAVQAMPEGGDLTIRAKQQNDNKIEVQVQDTGVGIPAAYLNKIFDPFFTTKDVGKGTGLGLSVSYGIIKKHGGRIHVKSRPGQGTLFTVVLPCRHPGDPH